MIIFVQNYKKSVDEAIAVVITAVIIFFAVVRSGAKNRQTGQSVEAREPQQRVHSRTFEDIIREMNSNVTQRVNSSFDIVEVSDGNVRVSNSANRRRRERARVAPSPTHSGQTSQTNLGQQPQSYSGLPIEGEQCTQDTPMPEVITKKRRMPTASDGTLRTAIIWSEILKPKFKENI